MRMIEFAKCGTEILTMDDWFAYAPPKQGEKHWRDNRSAKEMARYWLNMDSEENLRKLLKPAFGELRFLSAEPERLVQFDNCGEPRHCDLVIQAKGARETLLIHIEGKADEPFDKIVGPYYAECCLKKGSMLPIRMELLANRLFGRGVDAKVRLLWYQLMHATAAAWCDALACGATSAVVVVQEFRSPGLSKVCLERNDRAWKEFLDLFPELTEDVSLTDGLLLGPVRSTYSAWQGIPLHFVKVVTNLPQ